MRTNLKVFRTAHRLRQTDIAYDLGVSRATYSYIERGIRSGKAKFWQKLQQVYGVSDADMYNLMKCDEVEQCETKEK